MITFREEFEEVEELEEADMNQGQVDPNIVKVKSAELVARCFAARNAMHIFHLMSHSFSSHSAAKQFYEGIIPLIDGVAESIIGRLGILEAFPNVKESATDGLTIIGNLTKYIDANRQVLPQFSEIQNDIDGILSLCNKTAYLLRELK